MKTKNIPILQKDSFMIYDTVIVGGGIGGCSIAALLNAKKHNVLLIEKEPTLGGCASTFKHKGNLYNAGATTIAGYHEGGIVRRLCETIGVTPALISTDHAITIIQGKRHCVRYRDLERFIEEIERFYPHPKHAEFWRLVDAIGKTFYSMDGYYYSNRTWIKKLRSLLSFFPMMKNFKSYLLGDAKTFIKKFYGSISHDYLDFLDAQMMIVAQASSEKINFLTAALSLGYTFNETHYPIGGMGALCSTITSKLPSIRLGCTVKSISSSEGIYHVTTSDGSFKAKNIIMGTALYGSNPTFHVNEINNYYVRYQSLNNHQSAFVLYITLRSSRHFEHHYQFIASDIIEHTISKALFISFSDPSDTLIAPSGEYRITASIHTDAREWIGLIPSEYKHKKSTLQELLLQWILDTLSISKEEVTQCFSATPKTFGRYLYRTQLGGNSLTHSNALPFLPANDTPIEGFYNVGDTTYPAQGWPGVVMGAFNTLRMIDGRN